MTCKHYNCTKIYRFLTYSVNQVSSWLPHFPDSMHSLLCADLLAAVCTLLLSLCWLPSGKSSSVTSEEIHSPRVCCNVFEFSFNSLATMSRRLASSEHWERPNCSSDVRLRDEERIYTASPCELRTCSLYTCPRDWSLLDVCWSTLLLKYRVKESWFIYYHSNLYTLS